MRTPRARQVVSLPPEAEALVPLKENLMNAKVCPRWWTCGVPMLVLSGPTPWGLCSRVSWKIYHIEACILCVQSADARLAALDALKTVTISASTLKALKLGKVCP